MANNKTFDKIKDWFGFKKNKINKPVQDLYNKYSYGYSDSNDWQLMNELQEYNKSQKVPYLATGQSGYFHDQIMKDGLGSFKLNKQDMEDAKFISSCFGKTNTYSEGKFPVTYTTLLGSTEFNYGTQSFPAGIFEDVFQCSPMHDFPIQPIVGEKEQDFYIRLLELQIETYENFNPDNKQEVLSRAKRIIDNFCCHKNKVYLVKLSDVEELKASFGDIKGLRNAETSIEESNEIIKNLPSFSQLLSESHIDYNTTDVYSDPNMANEFGIALYGVIPPEKLQYIEVETKYEILQRKALELGYAPGETIPKVFEDKMANLEA